MSKKTPKNFPRLQHRQLNHPCFAHSHIETATESALSRETPRTPHEAAEFRAPLNEIGQHAFGEHNWHDFVARERSVRSKPNLWTTLESFRNFARRSTVGRKIRKTLSLRPAVPMSSSGTRTSAVYRDIRSHELHALAAWRSIVWAASPSKCSGATYTGKPED